MAVLGASSMQDAEDHGDWLAVLDEEVSRLPEKYRVLVVLCELEGLAQGGRAWTGHRRGDNLDRLSPAGGSLRDRLTRRGLALPAGALAAAIPADASAAAVRPALASATVRAALQYTTGGPVSWSVANLAEGALKAMFIARLQVGTVALLIVAALATRPQWRPPQVDGVPQRSMPAPLPPPNRLPASNRFATAAMSSAASKAYDGVGRRRRSYQGAGPHAGRQADCSHQITLWWYAVIGPGWQHPRSRKPDPEFLPPPGLTAPSRPAFPNP